MSDAPYILRGAPALSRFRVDKLLAELKQTPVRGLTATFLHVLDIEGELDNAELEKLKVILTYGPTPESDSAKHTGGLRRIVVPRLGTISPWSSKATDILRI
jgi:phosphoribosylformylglycinamidine synthase